MDSTHHFILEIGGKTTTFASGPDGRFYQPSIKLTEFHNTLTEAFEALAMRKIQLFEKSSGEAEYDQRFYEYGKILEKGAPDPLLEINIIPFDDAPGGSPTAGIYMITSEDSLKDLENRTGLTCPLLEEYDPDSPIVLLARFVYDRGLTVLADPALIQLQEKQCIKMQSEDLTGIDWKFFIEDIRRLKIYPMKETSGWYHYNNAGDALAAFINQDFRQFNADSRSNDIDTSLNLCHRNGTRIAEIVRISSDLYDNKKQPGIYLKLHQQPEVFKNYTGVDYSASNLLAFDNTIALYRDRDGQFKDPERSDNFVAITEILKSASINERKYSGRERRIIVIPPGGKRI